MKLRSKLLLVCTIIISVGIQAQDVNKMVVQTNKIGAKVQPTMYGLFFEDINFGADGGLYAELIKNRSFEFTQNLMGWNTFGKVTLKDDGPFERNPHYVRLFDAGHAHKRTGIENEGFFGIGLKINEQYRFSVWARGENQKIRVELINNSSMQESQAFVEKEINIDSREWKKYEVVITSPITIEKAHLRIFLTSGGPVDLEHVSLFPVDTWKGHKNGLRKDLAQALYDIHPGVFRFPGGCIVEGTDVESRYQWKHSVGPVENRPTIESRWHYTFPYRLYPDYFQSYGLGFYEYFLLSEEMNAEPLPIINVGMICQFQNPDNSVQPKMSELQPYIQDALDLVEFANGDTTTVWGKLRSEMGHPAPFNLKYLGIGNEQWDSIYPQHLKPFVEILRKTHPEIKLIGSSGPDSEGKQFDYLWPEMKKIKVDLVDEHFYRPESWFLVQGSRYDNYDRKGPKVFAGEYACHAKGKKWNHFEASLLEAAFMTGLERNADIVHMATYAPLFAHVEGWQWRPDLIWFDNLNSMKSCSYYVQQLFAMNKGTNVIPLTMNKRPVSGQKGQNGLFASAVWDNDSKNFIIKIVNTSDKEQAVEISFDGLSKKDKLTNGEIVTFHSENMDADNTLENPEAIVPVSTPVKIDGDVLNVDIPAKTFVMYKFAKSKL